MITTERLLDVFVQAADTMVDDHDLVDFLHQFTTSVVEVTGAGAVGLLLVDADDQLHLLAGSTQDVRDVELFQLQNQEGPCFECFRKGSPVIVGDLAMEASRWPAFAPRALAADFRAVHAFPLRLRARVIGALNVFGTQPEPLGDDDVKIIQALANVATIAILQERAVSAAQTVADQLQAALDSRVVIEQAKGVLARSHGLRVQDAFTLLRAYARTRGLRLTDVAAAVVDGSLDTDTVNPSGM